MAIGFDTRPEEQDLLEELRASLAEEDFVRVGALAMSLVEHPRPVRFDVPEGVTKHETEVSG